MTGPEHYTNAEADLDNAARASDRGQQDDVTYWIGCAQVHATLALAMAIADPLGYGGRSDSQWTDVGGTDAS